ncbi:MAG: hypothetical protein E6G35_14675 [Actinobacteria bacterium]|nr:MAG: hypothetical protein E6G35_14675 [Actinomycetota bacterium]
MYFGPSVAGSGLAGAPVALAIQVTWCSSRLNRSGWAACRNSIGSDRLWPAMVSEVGSSAAQAGPAMPSARTVAPTVRR